MKIAVSESERGIQPPVSQVRGRYSLKPILRGKVSRVGGVRSLLVHLGMPEFLADGGEGFPGRADVAVVRVKSSLVQGEAGKQFSAVEIVLRKAGGPQPGWKLVALLHEVAALVDFSQKQADGNVLGDVALDAGKLAAGFVYPDKPAHFGKDGSETCSGLEGRVGIHFIFGERALAALLFAGKSE